MTESQIIKSLREQLIDRDNTILSLRRKLSKIRSIDVWGGNKNYPSQIGELEREIRTYDEDR